MVSTDSRLLQRRIEGFELDDPRATEPFSRRLARENRWSQETARRTISEYKRFLVLAATADHAVTPSERVDQTWHLHITYTAEYRRFCRDVLGRELDHTPSAGGASERARFIRNYERTLESYFARFHEFPPADVWPPAKQRFGDDLLACRVNLADHWVVPKPRLWRTISSLAGSSRPSRTAALLLLVVLALSTVACATQRGDAVALNGPEFLHFHLVLWVTTLAAAGALRLWERKRLSVANEPQPELDAYEVAALGGGSNLAFDAAVSALVERGAVECDRARGTLKSVRTPVTTQPPFEGEIHEAIARAGEPTLGEIRSRFHAIFDPLEERLEALGLVRARSSALPLALALLAPLIGGLRVLSRLGTDKPIAFLVVLCVIGLVVAFVGFRPRPFRTQLGETTLAELRRRHESLPASATASELAASGMLPLAVGLFGVATLGDLSQTSFASVFDRRTADPNSGHGHSGGGGCGYSGGDGGGGDGGGGCGGCGGGCGGGD